jgi:hypothetical protein
MRFQDILFGLVCGSFHFVPQSPVVPSAFFGVDILPFPSLTHFTDHFRQNITELKSVHDVGPHAQHFSFTEQLYLFCILSFLC